MCAVECATQFTFPSFLFYLKKNLSASERLERKKKKTWERTERMPKMVATGTRIGIRASLFSSGCLWFVSWHPHCRVEWCYNILTISRSRNVNSPFGYFYKIVSRISSGGWNKDERMIQSQCGPTPVLFLFPISLLVQPTFFFPPSSCPAVSSFLKCGKSY